MRLKDLFFAGKKAEGFSLSCPNFSNFRFENGKKIADVEREEFPVSQQEYVSFKNLCEGLSDCAFPKTISQSEIENWNDFILKAAEEKGMTPYLETVSERLFGASMAMESACKKAAPVCPEAAFS